MSRKFSKIGVILVLLVLLFGPVLQEYDCFNDAPNLDHDGILHGIDALFCIAFTLLIFTGLLLGFMKALCLSRQLPRQLEASSERLIAALPFPPWDTSALALRI